MTLGSLIRKARTDAGLSIDELSDQTKIRPAMLKEIENNEFGHCGGETYARGHLRNIAKKLKINPEDFLSIYEQEQIKDLLIENNVVNSPSQERKISWKVLASISLILLVVVGIAQIVISNSHNPTKIPALVNLSPSPQTSNQGSVQVQSQRPAPTNTISTGKGVEVIISATRAKSWIFVSDATGVVLFSGIISKGDVKTFSSVTTLAMRIGNAGGVDLTVNGKKIASIGGDGEVVDTSYGVDS